MIRPQDSILDEGFESLSTSELIALLIKGNVANLAHLEHEEFWGLFLNAAHCIEGISQLSKGGVTSTVVDLPLLIKKVLDCRVVDMILIQNHPCGTFLPSESDKKLT